MVPQALGTPVEVAHRTATVDGLELHYVEAGAGDPVILLHGWPQHWWQWREVIGPLAESFRVIAPDGRGQGWSQGRAGSYTIDRQARDLIGLMDALGIDQARVVGHDVGAFFGYYAALNWPERFVQLVPMAGLHPWSFDGLDPRMFGTVPHIYRIALLGRRALAGTDLVASRLRRWRHAGEFAPAEIAAYTERADRPEVIESTVNYFRNVLRSELPYFVRNYKQLHLTVPTLHLNGADDPVTKYTSESFTKYADDIALERVPDCGHFIAEEQPDWLSDRLIRFFKEER